MTKHFLHAHRYLFNSERIYKRKIDETRRSAIGAILALESVSGIKSIMSLHRDNWIFLFMMAGEAGITTMLISLLFDNE